MWWINQEGQVLEPPTTAQLADFDQRNAQLRDAVQKLIDLTLAASVKVHNSEDPSPLLKELTVRLDDILAEPHFAMNLINALVSEVCRGLAYRTAVENTAVFVLQEMTPGLPPDLSGPIAHVYNTWLASKKEADDAGPAAA